MNAVVGPGEDEVWINGPVGEESHGPHRAVAAVHGSEIAHRHDPVVGVESIDGVEKEAPHPVVGPEPGDEVGVIQERHRRGGDARDVAVLGAVVDDQFVVVGQGDDNGAVAVDQQVVIHREGDVLDELVHDGGILATEVRAVTPPERAVGQQIVHADAVHRTAARDAVVHLNAGGRAVRKQLTEGWQRGQIHRQLDGGDALRPGTGADHEADAGVGGGIIVEDVDQRLIRGAHVVGRGVGRESQDDVFRAFVEIVVNGHDRDVHEGGTTRDDHAGADRVVVAAEAADR